MGYLSLAKAGVRGDPCACPPAGLVKSLIGIWEQGCVASPLEWVIQYLQDGKSVRFSEGERPAARPLSRL